MSIKKRSGEPEADLDVRIIETESLVVISDTRPRLLDAEGCVTLGESDWHGLQILVGPEAFAAIDRHTSSDTACEVGGFLIGRPFEWQGRSYLEITSAMAGKTLSSSAFHVTISSDTWVRAREQVQQASGGDYIVGWYHTHPNMSVFMSPQDLAVHEGFFRESWQVALVIEPNSREASFFAWVEGRIRKVTCYQVVFPLNVGADERWRLAQGRDVLAIALNHFQVLTNTLGWWHNRWVPGDHLCLRVGWYAMKTLNGWLVGEQRPRFALCRGLKTRPQGLEDDDTIAIDVYTVEMPIEVAFSDPPAEGELKLLDTEIERALRKRDYLYIVGWVWLGEVSHPILAEAERGRWPELKMMMYHDGADEAGWCWRSKLGEPSTGVLVELVTIAALSEARLSETLARVRQAFVEAQRV